jgi:hypothetical protein
MNSRNDGTPTDLYLVRIWRRKSGDGAPNFHGKLQHIVSGANCYFDGLSSLPQAMAEMLEQQTNPFSSDAGSAAGDGPDEEAR